MRGKTIFGFCLCQAGCKCFCKIGKACVMWLLAVTVSQLRGCLMFFMMIEDVFSFYRV